MRMRKVATVLVVVVHLDVVVVGFPGRGRVVVDHGPDLASVYGQKDWTDCGDGGGDDENHDFSSVLQL